MTGFGHEEWNFQLEDNLNGFIFPYTYITPDPKKLKESDGKFDIGFFTRHPTGDLWLFVGVHKNVQLITPDEYIAVERHFAANDIFTRRAAELSQASDAFKDLKKAKIEVLNSIRKKYIKLKSPADEVAYFEHPIPIKKPANTHFKTFTYVKEFPPPDEKYSKSHKHSALAEDGYYRETSTSLNYILKLHNKLSNEFCAWLRQFNIDAKQEVNFVDVSFKHKKKTYMAELKTTHGITTTKAIREAMGQLLEYNYYPGRSVADQWLIILDKTPTINDVAYANSLCKNLGIHLQIGWAEGRTFKFSPGYFF